MRISDWSSDVCSSDLQNADAEPPRCRSCRGAVETILGRCILAFMSSGRTTKTRRMDKSPGLEEAIRAAGGIPALAHALDVALPSVSAWRHLPEKHVADAEALTGVERRVLRPDLYPESGMTAAAGRDEKIGRAAWGERGGQNGEK